MMLSDMIDMSHWMLYDRLIIPKGTRTKASYRLFDKPIGINDKNLESTNMLTSCRLPAPQSFLITHMSIFSDPVADSQQYAKFISNYGGLLQLGSKIYFESPGAFIPNKM